jgi:Holliday junction resolvase RusA-like endonuclease
MPTEYKERREKLQWLFKEAGGQLNIEGHVSLTVAFRFKMPESWSKKKREATNGSYCGKKPDIDNCIGAVMDALFANDSRVIMIKAHKQWSYEDSIFIIISIDDG